jgi:hypothetical protein
MGRFGERASGRRGRRRHPRRRDWQARRRAAEFPAYQHVESSIVTLELVSPRDKFKLKQGFVSNEVVLGHLEWVLKSFAAKPEYSRFYIGITNELERRLADHRGDATKKDFRLMCPIVEEESPQALGGAFDGLELAAIARFNPGVMNIETNKLLKCMNGKQGVTPKCVLYILVG